MPLNVRYTIILCITNKEKICQLNYNMLFIVRHIQVLKLLWCKGKKKKQVKLNDLWYYLHFYGISLQEWLFQDHTWWHHPSGSDVQGFPTLPRVHCQVLGRWSISNLKHYMSVGHCDIPFGESDNMKSGLFPSMNLQSIWWLKKDTYNLRTLFKSI